jgi:hypothetical protein
MMKGEEPPNKSQTMHQRVKRMRSAAERNARELNDRRKVIDDFKGLGKPQDPAVTFSFVPTPDVKGVGDRSKISHATCNSFAQRYSLNALSSALKEPSPAFPACKTGSMLHRLEACEHRALWNHQTMSHHRSVITKDLQFPGRQGGLAAT